jgi:hypothetical protein
MLTLIENNNLEQTFKIAINVKILRQKFAVTLPTKVRVVALLQDGARQQVSAILKERIAATTKRATKMVRPWLEKFGRNANGKRIKPKRSSLKKQLACATTKPARKDGRSHGAMPQKKIGNGWTKTKSSFN